MRIVRISTLLFAAAASFAVVFDAAADPEWMDHASWCLKPDGATRTLAEQPVTAGNCAQFQAGALLTSYFSGNSTAVALATSETQYGLGVAAADFACHRDVISDQIAIRLLQVCQCHNIGAQTSIENNQQEVLAWLRGWRGGPPKSQPCS
jgi:chloramphenicol 3-O-phosphotransferase